MFKHVGREQEIEALALKGHGTDVHLPIDITPVEISSEIALKSTAPAAPEEWFGCKVEGGHFARGSVRQRLFRRQMLHPMPLEAATPQAEGMPASPAA